MSFETELEKLINKYSKENDSNTPDFILAKYLNSCLYAFNGAVKRRDIWYGVNLEPANSYFKKDSFHSQRDM